MLIEIRDTAIHVRTEGSGSPLLFVHGFPFHGGMWDAQLAALPDGWHAIVPDLRGFGRSQPGEREAWTMDLFADDLAALLDELGHGRVVLCGLSMGGYVSFAFWRRHRDRVRALVLADTRPEADDDEGRANRLEVADRVLRDGSASLADELTAKLLAPVSLGRPALVERVRAMIVDTSPATIAMTQRAMAQRPDSRPDLPGIDVPTLVLTGSEDEMTGPVTARAMVGAIPHALLEIVPGAGHLSPMERPDAFSERLAAWLHRL